MNDRQAIATYAKNGDQTAFAQVVRHYERLVYRTCLRKLENTADAEDATQETFLKLAKNAGSVRGDVASWLYCCANSTSIDLVRKKQSQRRSESEYASKVMEPDANWDDARSVVDAAIAKLPEEDRQLIVHHYLLGRTQTQLAKEAGITQSGIHRRIEKILGRIQITLKTALPSISIGLVFDRLADDSRGAVPETVSQKLHQLDASPQISAPPRAQASVPSSEVKWLSQYRLPLLMLVGCLIIGVVIYQTVDVSKLLGFFNTPAPSPPASNPPMLSPWQTDAQLAAASVDASLRALDLSDTEITNNGLRHLGKFANLQHLELCESDVNRVGLTHLAQLEHLEVLWLTHVTLKKEDFEVLHELSSLKRLNLAGADIPSGLVADYVAGHPDVEVVHP